MSNDKIKKKLIKKDTKNNQSQSGLTRQTSDLSWITS
jgi:hypothetical protein